MSNSEESQKFELVLTNALKLPGVKVDRKEFLASALSKHTNSTQLSKAIEVGPVEAGIKIETLDKVANSLINKRTLHSSSYSFAAGIPGGLAMGATIPADTVQFFGFSLRLAQEIAYLYGYEDLWEDEKLDHEKVRGDLTLFLGVMFGVSGASSSLKFIAGRFSKQALYKIPKKALTKTIYYPIVKKVAQTLGYKITKEVFAKGVSKAIPVIGGVISGGLTLASMKPMGNRLKDSLSEAAKGRSEEEAKQDLEDLKEVFDVDYTFIDEEEISNK